MRRLCADMLAPRSPEAIRALLDLDAMEADRLCVSGRAPWQVLAGAAKNGGGFTAELLTDEAPYGVSYLVASWLHAS